MFVSKVHANSLNEVSQSLSQSQQETSEIKSKLETTKTEAVKLQEEKKVQEDKIIQLEKENSELKG